MTWTPSNPPVASDLASGAQITTTGASGITLTGTANQSVYFNGIIFNCGTGTSAAVLTISTGEIIMENCSLKQLTTSATASMAIGGSVGTSRLVLINTPITLNGGAASSIAVSNGQFFWRNTPSSLTAAATLTGLFSTVASRHCDVFCDGLDLSTITSGNAIVAANASQASIFQFKNCKITSGATFATPTLPGAYVDVFSTSSSAQEYAQLRRMFQGSLDVSTTVTNNATDGVTAHSWTVVTTANAKRQSPFECFEIVQWVAAGTFAASTIMCTSATASLTNADIWVETYYMASASTPVASMVTSGTATFLTAGSTLAAGTWTTGGLGNNYKLAIPSFTTAIAGYVRFVVKVAKASLTINVDPAVTVA